MDPSKLSVNDFHAIFDIFECLINKNRLIINEKFDDGKTWLHVAIGKQSLKVVEFLLDSGADANVRDNYGNNCLYVAAGQGNLEILKLIVPRTANVNSVNNLNETPLHVAVMKNKVDNARYLVNHCQADVNVLDRNDCNPLFYACSRYSNKPMIEFLLECGADPNVPESSVGTTPLHASLEYCCDEENGIFDLMLKHGADINAVNSDHWNLLHYAAHFCNIKMIFKLTEMGLDILKKSLYDETFLHILFEWNQLELEEAKLILQFAIDKGLDLNAQNFYGHTFLSGGTTNSVDVTEYILSLGVDPNIHGPEESPLSSAVLITDKELVECLISNGAKVDFSKQNGECTLLNISLRNGHCPVEEKLEIAKLLMLHGVVIGNRDHECVRVSEFKQLQDCHEEFNLLKITKICADLNFTYCDILSQRDNLVARCLRNDLIKTVMRSEAYKQQFPYFADELEVNYLLRMERLEMLEEFAEMLFNLLPLPYDVVERIAEFLSSDDLKICLGYIDG